MKVLAISGSPLTDKGNTDLVLSPFLEGMRQAGANVELIYLKKLDIGPCQGDYNCWIRTPGECFQKDDMQMLYPKLKQADIWVIAVPVYVDGMPGPIKTLFDRMIPFSDPFFVLRDGHCRHDVHGVRAGAKMVLVANCGFWEMDNFDPLVAHMKAICKNMDREFAGAILRPHGPAMAALLHQGLAPDDVFEAAGAAGRQLVEQGEMSSETLKVISRPLLPLEDFVKRTNRSFTRAREKAKARRKTRGNHS